MNSEKKESWKEAIESEKKTLIKMNTWTVQEKPPNQPTVKAKWIFRTKTNPDGTTKTKARLVAKGFTQIKFINYEDTFAPVIRKESLRYLLSHAVANDFEVHHMDVETAFLNGKLNEEIYMELPEGFGKDTGKIVKLIRSLYGLKQSPHVWYGDINETLKKNNYYPTKSDPCIYIKREKESKKVIGIIGLYVDDCIPIGTKDEVKRMKEILTNSYKMKDLGEVKLILGMEIERTKNELKIYQRNYIRKILEKFKMSDCKKVDTPIEDSKYNKEFNPTNSLMKKNEENSEIPFANRELYYQAVGSLNYLSCTTRPDISFATNVIARHMSNPLEKHWTQVKRIFRYLKGTIDYSLTYTKDPTDKFFRKIVGYSDASYAPNPNDRKSVGAYIFNYNGGAISWSSKRQSIVALSSCEAEYIALCECAKESQWLSHLHQELNGHDDPILIFEDNQAAIKLAENSMFSNRTKHIQVRFHYIRELVADKKIILNYCPTDLMVADALTKGLLKVKLTQLRELMGIKKNSI